MFAGDEKDLTKTLASKMTRFRRHLINIEGDTQNRVVPRETAISTIVDAFVRKIKRRKKAHCPAKILQREPARDWRHRFEFPIGLGRDPMLEPVNQRRSPATQAV